MTNKRRLYFLLSVTLIASKARFCSSFITFSERSRGPRLLDNSKGRNLAASVFLPDQREDRSQTPPLHSNFWGNTVQRGQDVSVNGLPTVPSLDAHGELPLGAYTAHGNPSYAPTDICRISLALDTEKRRSDQELDIPNIVRSMQRYLDDGFQTLQVKSGPGQQHTVVEEEILGRFLDETPAFAREKCSFILPLRIPSVASGVLSSTFVRRHVTASLQRTGLEAVNCIQLQYRKQSPYLLDILDILEDLKREGMVGSVGARNIPPLQLREAHANGFELHSNQLDMNVLNPTRYDTEQKLMCSDLGVSLMASSPLAGGLLCDRYRENMFEPLSTQLSLNGNRFLKTTLPDWNKRFAGDSNSNSRMTAWQRFHRNLLPALADIALKHRVSIASVCLRWLLQLKHVSSAAVSLNLMEVGMNDNEDLKTSQRIKTFRDVFRFELDEEDMNKIWELSGMEEPSDEIQFSFDDDDSESEYAMRFEQRNGLFLP